MQMLTLVDVGHGAPVLPSHSVGLVGGAHASPLTCLELWLLWDLELMDPVAPAHNEDLG